MKNFATKYSIAISAVAVILFVFLLFKSCHKTISSQPVFVNPKTVVDSVSKDENIKNAHIDSLNKVINILQNSNSSLQSNLNSVRLNEEDLAASLRAQIQPNKQDVDNYIDTSEKRDSICDQLNHNKDLIIIGKDSIISTKDSLYSDTKKSLNFLATQSEAQLKYEKTLQPKNQLYIGGGLYGNKLTIIQGIDAGIIFKNKKDRVYKADVMYDFNTGVNFAISTYFKIHL
jgi:hypothetical protein